MKYLAVVLLLVSVSFAAPAKSPKAVDHHAGVKIAHVLAAPFVHPKRTSKQILGSVLFASEPVVDVAHVTFSALDSALLSEKFKPYDPIHYLARGAFHLDNGWEKAEDYFFGWHN